MFNAVTIFLAIPAPSPLSRALLCERGQIDDFLAPKLAQAGKSFAIGLLPNPA
jgi:hypothetical protein